MLMRPPRLAILFSSLFFIPLILLTSLPGTAQQQVEPDKVVKKTQAILVTDEKGAPIEGALFEPFGLNSSYFWPEQLMGKAESQRSNREGIVSLRYPEIFADGVATNTIDCAVSHPRFVCNISRIKINEGEKTLLQLHRGISLKIHGVDEKGVPITERFGVAMSGEVPIRTWSQSRNTVEAHSVAEGMQQFIAVQPMPDGRTRFSQTISRAFRKEDLEKGVEFEEVELSEGVRIHGALSENVVRPVRNGMVILHQFPLPIPNAAQLKLEQLSWQDWVPIHEDGSFEISSVPRSGTVQLIAVCQGWSSVTNTTSTIGETYSIVDDDLQVTLKMKPTLEAIIRVVDPKGVPIEGVTFGFGPNQSLNNFGSQTLGSRSKAILEIRKQLGEKVTEESFIMERAAQYSDKSDADGRIRIANLPNGLSRFRFYASKKGFVPLSEAIEPADFQGLKGPKEIVLKPME